MLQLDLLWKIRGMCALIVVFKKQTVLCEWSYTCLSCCLWGLLGQPPFSFWRDFNLLSLSLFVILPLTGEIQWSYCSLQADLHSDAVAAD